MGVQVVRHCYKHEQDDDTNQDKLSQQHIQSIRSDFKYFNEQKWFRFQQNILFDCNTFIFLYPDYHSEQEQMIEYWKKVVDFKRADSYVFNPVDQVLSPKWKYAIRKGVPVIHYKTMLGHIFNRRFQNSSDLKNTLAMTSMQIKAIKDQKQNCKPLFGIDGLSSRFKEECQCNFLNQQGIRKFQLLLHTIQNKNGQITYNRYILNVIPMLLIFLNEEETFQVICQLIENSINMKPERQASMRWHFTPNQSQLIKLAENFFDSLKEKSFTINKIIDHFNRNKIDRVEIYREIVQNFFYGYLPFSMIIKILLIFLNQGVKVLHRIFYALLKVSFDDLVQSTTKNGILQSIRKKSLMMTAQQSQRFIKIAFTLRLNKYSFGRVMQSSVDSEEFIDNVKYYLPKIKGSSQILSFNDLQTIWEFLPLHLKNYDTTRKFSCPSENKTKEKLPSLIQCMNPEDSGFIIIESTDDAVFGIFLASWLKHGGPKQFYGSSQNFLFQIHPKKKKYPNSAQNIFYCFTPNGTQCKFGGGGSGPSLSLSFDLASGLSFRSDTYNNQPLHSAKGGQFKIKKLEVFQLY